MDKEELFRKQLQLLLLSQVAIEVADDCLHDGQPVQREKQMLKYFYNEYQKITYDRMGKMFNIDPHLTEMLLSNYQTLFKVFSKLASETPLENVPEITKNLLKFMKDDTKQE